MSDKQFTVHYCPRCQEAGEIRRIGALGSRDGPNGSWQTYRHQDYTVNRCPVHGVFAVFDAGHIRSMVPA